MADTQVKLERVTPERVTGTAMDKKILVVDADKYWQELYKNNLGGIAKIVTIDNCTDAYKILKGKGWNVYTKDADFNAYIIDPSTSPFKWPIRIKEMLWDTEGLELISEIGKKENDYGLVWVISNNHDALKKVKNFRMGESVMNHIYTKNSPEWAEGFKTQEIFFKDIENALMGNGYTPLCDPF